MIAGLSISAFTSLHVILSLVGIVAGLVAAAAMLGAKRAGGWTALFLATTILTSITGYMFPADKVLPSHVVGALSLIVLALAVIGLYRYRLEGAWRWIYVVTALVSLYLNCFVAVVQAFLKIPSLKALAPTQAEPPFLIAQAFLLAALVALTIVALKKFHPAPIEASLQPRRAA